MTNEQLWDRLEKAVKTKSLLKRAVKMSLLLKHGYEQDLDILVSGSFRDNDPEALYLGYIDNDCGDNFIMCYTGWEHAHKEWRAGETENVLYGSTAFDIRAVVNDLYDKKSVTGIVFNPEDEDTIFILPKVILEKFIPREML